MSAGWNRTAERGTYIREYRNGNHGHVTRGVNWIEWELYGDNSVRAHGFSDTVTGAKQCADDAQDEWQHAR